MIRRKVCAAAIRGAVLAAAATFVASGAHALPPVPAVKMPAPKTVPRGAALSRADFGTERPWRDARTIADWVVRSRDAGGAAFFIIDKPRARLYVFDPQGRLRGAAPVLLGLAKGDDTVPGIADKPLEAIAPHERTTPAGRFVAERGFNAHGEDVVWVDYAAAVSLHRVRPLKAEEHRLERLASPRIGDNRISYGCINVPAAFFDRVVTHAWSAGNVVVYVLPDKRPLEGVFPRPRTFVSAAALVRRAG